MEPVLSREQMRAFDRFAIEKRGVPSLILMENAGRGATDIVEGVLRRRPGEAVVIAGPGNNGGDGFVVARHLVVRGHSVHVLLTAPIEKLKGDARINYDSFLAVDGEVSVVATDEAEEELSSRLSRASVVIDALFGTGLDRDVGGWLARVIEMVNSAGARRISLDIPSGLHADTGTVLGVAVRADDTITFAHWKLGLLSTTGAEHAGRVTIADIGVPSGFVEHVGLTARVLNMQDVARAVAPRRLSAHKGSEGRVFVVAGSPGKTGAALLVARGALRAGAGSVTIATSPEAADALDQRVLEEMTARMDPDDVETSLDSILADADSVIIGPGLGLDATARRVVDHVALHCQCPVVLDADALTHLGGRLGDLIDAPGPRILTPHPGEMGRLLGSSASEVEADRFGAVSRAVAASGAVVVLKGPRTIIGARGEKPVVNTSGTPALATAGSGDVLGGIVGALAARRGGAMFVAAYSGVYFHATSAEQWSDRFGGNAGMVAHEIADGVPSVLAALANARSTLPV